LDSKNCLYHYSQQRCIKKIAVLAGLKVFVEHLGENRDELKAGLLGWIDMII